MLTVRERRKREAHSEVVELVGEYGAGRVEALLNVHPDTVRRWISGAVQPPTAVLIALRAAVHGQVPGMTVEHWRGWRFNPYDGRLYAPDGRRGYHAGDIMARQYERAQIRALQRQVAILEEKLARATVSGTDRAANDGDLSVRLRSR